MYSCVGNIATVATGEAKGATGRVIGHHGGSEHVIVDFDREVKEKLLYTDTIIIRGKGQGLKLTDYPDNVKNYTDLPEITWRQIEHFFVHYKDLEPGKWVKFAGWGDAEEAQKLISESIERAKIELK